ncbi:hypothetical protein [Candidatus Nitrospira nitrificans]|uniref:DUF1795 domain-containing protein n=1 Tax=Candidatus Nitrospira nitrificans TaxID=1742973 RepID=A0A0S4LCV3_9BACT|nr:hypothetical protein [Candidatus Nitrospira nitrificans]CUS35007.1 exported hypothetical protein [Candidatus Nitrospira nitrificans]
MNIRRHGRAFCPLLILMTLAVGDSASIAAGSDSDAGGWKLYTNARYGFSVRYPGDWRLGNPMPDGNGITLYPSIEHSLVAVSGHMNVVSGSSQDGRQTLDEFASAHRRIITDLYGKKHIAVSWRPDREISLAGFPGKQLVFTYKDDTQGEMIEHHIFSLGRNEGRGIRVKAPLSAEERLMAVTKKILETYQPGRDQNAVSPFVPKPESR